MDGIPRVSNILITGGTGLVGRSIVRNLEVAGHSLRVLSRKDQPWGSRNVSICRGDVLRVDDVRAAMQGCDAVFHCAAEKHDLATMEAVNVDATRLVFDVASEARVAFFCHLSSVGVTGKVSEERVDESTACAPTNFYEETKLRAEEIVRAGLDSGRVVLLRPTNVFGPETLAPMFANKLAAWARLLVTGNEHSHFVYVEDVAAAAAFCMSAAPTAAVETFIVSSDEEPGGTFREVQALLASISAGVPQPPRFALPVWVPRCLRSFRGRPANRSDVLYSSRRLTAAGFVYPFGRARGLREALAGLQSARGEVESFR